MTIKDTYDVIIAGAGPCGVTSALLLARQGVKCLLIDREANILDIPRAIAMCEEGSRILETTGAMPQIRKNLQPVSRVVFADKNQERVFFADLNQYANGYPLLRMFYQPGLEADLRNDLQQYDNIDIRTCVELVDFTDVNDGVTVSLRIDGQVVTSSCKYLLGCDGSRSFIREKLDIQFEGDTYPQDWVVIDIDQNPLHDEQVMFSINPERPSVTMPAPNNKRRWEFVVKKGENPDELFSDKNLARLLRPWGDLNKMKIERKAVYTFHARTAERFSRGNVFLLGDAAHITPPFAGQGLMAGLRDAYNLCWKVATVLEGRAGQALLDSYDLERRPQAGQVVAFAQRMGNIILPQNPVMAGVRDKVIGFLGLLGLHSDTKPVPMDKIPNHINGSLLRNMIISKAKGTGIAVPIPPANDGFKVFDAVVGEHYCLLAKCEEDFAGLSAATRQRWQALGGKLIALDRGDISNPDGLYDRVLKGGRKVLLVRPDKIIARRFDGKHLNRDVAAYLQEIGAKDAA